MSARPLVSFVIIAYRQDAFIREAVRGALQQTYEPLEVIVSDDCSPDRTYEIIQEELASYRGPHKTLSIRQPRNIGLAGNLAGAWSHAKGDLVVVQGGDDISLPGRTERLVAAWLESPEVDCLFSDYSVIDAQGVELTARRFGDTPPGHPESIEQVLQQRTCWVIGCSAAYRPSLMSKYGGLRADVLAEDNVLPFRALLGRGIRYVAEPLVRYRVHGNNIFHGTAFQARQKLSRQKAQHWAQSRSAVAQEWLRNWDLSGRQDRHIREGLERIAQERLYDANGYSFSRAGAFLLAVKGVCGGLPLRKAGGLIKRHVLRVA